MSGTTEHTGYVLGHSPEELRRLDQQGAVIRPLTRRVLREAGIAPGMRVLDAGCGSGDVSLLVRELVGPSGHVVAVDRASEALGTTRDRFHVAGFANATFVEADLDLLALDEPVDVVVGRLVLMYAPDPAATLRHLRTVVRPGGLLAFMDLVLPPALLCGEGRWPEADRARTWVVEAFHRVGRPTDLGLRLPDVFVEAGLPRPESLIEAVAIRHDEPEKLRWLAGTVRSLLPAIVKTGIATEAEVAIETLAERLIEEAAASPGTVVPIAYGAAWARTPRA